MKSIDHALWEREIADYIGLHPDLANLPPPAFPRRRSRLGRWFWLYRQACRSRRRARRARRRERFRASYLWLVITLLVLETLVLGGIAGWWLGWHL